MMDRRRLGIAFLALGVSAACMSPPSLQGQQLPPTDRAPYVAMDGAELYGAACANCHGVDGTGTAPDLLAFEEEMPDFTDCAFASREPDGDWVAVAHEGGPVRGFSEMMPAFGGVLGPEELQRVMEYIRTMCGDAEWPRGELNLPRAMFTEKAYPEDEWVNTVDVPLESGDASIMNEFIYEKRFGKKSQIEVVIPFGFRKIQRVFRLDEASDGASPSIGSGGGAQASDEWVTGLGDVVFGVKHALWHSFEAGSIFSLGGEVKFPTGKTEDGFGGGSTVFEGFASFGQILPSDGFLQLQGVFEAPTASEKDNEVIARGVLGKTFTAGGPWGRAWSPMLEFQGKRDLVEGEEWSFDFAPQVQVALNTRQHVLANFAVLFPLTDSDIRATRLYVYVLLDWFDGGFFEGW